jgi:hypothetical protein
MRSDDARAFSVNTLRISLAVIRHALTGSVPIERRASVCSGLVFNFNC